MDASEGPRIAFDHFLTLHPEAPDEISFDNGDDREIDEATAVQRAIASLEAGASPGETKDALANWKEYPYQ
eukprot:jgi/Tetstr1/436002/TSEL_024883.t1